jgi:hypothetical protein
MRPRKLDTEKRSRETVVLFTTKERAAIEVKASTNGLSISAHLRQLALKDLRKVELNSDR